MYNSFFSVAFSLKRISLLQTLSVVLTLFLFAQCKQDKKGDGQTAGTPTEAVTPNTLQMRIEADGEVLNPILKEANNIAHIIAGNIFQQLGATDPATLELKPLMIKSLPQAEKMTQGPRKGSLAYAFEILPEAAWDNGSSITGHDVAFSVKAIFDPLLPTDQFRGYFEHLQDIEVDAANPKKFTAYYSEYYLLALEGLCGIPIYPAYHYDPAGRMAKIALADLLNPKKAATFKADANLKAFSEAFVQPKFIKEKGGVMGSNAYALERSVSGVGVVLVRKKDWWGDKLAGSNPLLAAYPEKLVYRNVKEEATAENMIRNRELDVVATFSPGKYLEMKADPKLAADYDFGVAPSALYACLLVNNSDPRLADRRIRQAIAHAIDYDGIIANVHKGLARRTVGPVNPAKPYYNKNIQPYNSNIGKAKELLAAAGWRDTDGNGIIDKVVSSKKTDFTLNLISHKKTEGTRLSCENIADNIRKAGIDVQIQWIEPTLIKAEIAKGNYALALTVVQNAAADDQYQLLHSKSLAPAGGNTTRFANQKADKMIDGIRNEPDNAKRSAMLLGLQQLLHEELPMIFLWVPDQRIVSAKRFEPVRSANPPGYVDAMFKLKK